MRRRRRRRHNYLSFLLLLVAFSPPISHAQANINPALPAATLERGNYWSLFPTYETVVNAHETVPPLTVRQKFEIAYRKTFSPALPIDSLAIAGFDQATNLGPAYGQEWGAFGKRVGYNAANFTTKSLFAFGIVPAAFHQDPRYFRLGSGSFRARMGWVLRSQVVAFSDRGTAMPNYGKLIGYAASTALSNAYMPRQSVSRGNDLEGYGIKFGASILVSTIHEFDLTRLIERRHSHP
jgi:hypothetical protein